MKKRILTLASVLLLLLCWQVVAMWVNQPELIPGLPRLVKTLVEMLFSTGFYLSVGATLLRGLIGMLISLLTALLFALLFVRNEWVYGLFTPLLTLMRSVPVISFILFALIFLHTESIPLLIGFLTMFPLLTENLTKGFRAMRPELSVISRLFLIGRRNNAFVVIYPQLKPFLYSGLASAIGFGWRAIIMGEVLAQTALGIGSEMKKAQSFIAVPELISWTIVAVIISHFSDKIIRKTEDGRIAVRYLSTTTKKPPVASARDIRLSHAAYRYGASDYSCHFTSGMIYGISAPSGAGKTTLLNLINGTLHPVRGTVTVDRSKGFASVLQEVQLFPDLTVEENICFPLARYSTREEARLSAQPILKVVEMDLLADRYPAELSYGQQQRVAIARAMAFPSPYLLMDEPFKGIDSEMCMRIIRYIRERSASEPLIVLFTTHNQEELQLLADEVLTIEQLP